MSGAHDNAPMKVHRLLSAAASDNATLIIGRRAELKLIQGHNAKATPVYLKIYDKLTAPASTDTPVMTIYLPATASFVLNYEYGIPVTLGLGYRLVAGGADNDATALVAADILALNIGYTL